MNVFLRAGKEVVRMGEEYTTMACKDCGILNDKHSSEWWTCKNVSCGAFHLRDPASSICIFKKALGRN
jgi:transposase